MLKCIKALMGRLAFSVSLAGPIKDVSDKAHLSFCVCFVSVLISDTLRAQDTFFSELSLQQSLHFCLIIHTPPDLMCFQVIGILEKLEKLLVKAIKKIIVIALTRTMRSLEHV